MKIIEGLKQIKDLQRKADDLRTLVSNHCAISSFDTPMYPDQKKKVREWIQAYSDILREISRIRTAVQRTNLNTQVSIELGGKTITKSITEWIYRRRDLATLELHIWKALTDRGIREGQVKGPTGDPIDMKIIRYFDPEERDNKIDLYSSEPITIDSKLEIVNAITDLIE